jgi:hypothetical protein
VIGEETAAYIMSGLIGLPYPQGDPEVLRAAARHWRKVSAIIAESEKVAERAVGVMVEGGQTGAAITAFYDLTEQVLPHLGQLKLATEHMAMGLEKFADHLQQARHEFNYLAWKVAVDIGVTVMFGFLTIGIGSAVAVVYLSRAAIVFFRVFGAYQKAAIIAAASVTYWTLDSIAYTALDVGAIKAVDYAYGEKGTDLKKMINGTFWGNMAFDAAVDGEAKFIQSWLGKAVASNVWVRAAMRMSASGLIYTPVDNAVQGKAIADWLPDENQREHKVAVHALGRVWLPEHHREGSAAVGRAVGRTVVRGLLGR